MRQTGKNVSPFSNEARNTYVVEHMTESLLKHLRQKPISEISISEICDDAGVGRASFYRNFDSKEDIVRKYLHSQLSLWRKQYDSLGKDSNSEMYGSLFGYLKDNAEFYQLLGKRNLLYMLSEILIDIYGAKTEDENMWAYTKSFIAYGTYGWIQEWISRGMQESAETMTTLLSQNGMK